MNTKDIIIKNLLGIISGYNTDGVSKEMVLCVEDHHPGDVSVWRIVTKGEAHSGTPFFSSSAHTMIVREDYSNGVLVYASSMYQEPK